MLLRFIAVIPFLSFWRPYRSYSGVTHRIALRKLGVLWLISVVPLLVAAALKPVPDAKSLDVQAFGWKLWHEFNGTHQFIYAVSFIAPILYLLYEDRTALWNHVISGKRTTKDLQILHPGFGWVFVCSCMFFLFTAIAFAVSTSVQDSNEPTFLDQLSNRSALLVYVFALFCWYLTILNSVGTPSQDFTEVIRKEENTAKEKFGERIAGREESNE